MRMGFFGCALVFGGVSTAALAEPVGLPTNAFVSKWVALPTSHFTKTDAAPTSVPAIKVRVRSDGLDGRPLEEAFRSAANDVERHGIALSDMMAAWDQRRRAALQHLRDDAHAYSLAASDPSAQDARDDAFLATVARVSAGAGRSAVTAAGGGDDAALGAAYDEALSGVDDDTRDAIAAAQRAWFTYRDSFAAYADDQKPGSAPAVRAELTQRRIAELAAEAGK